MTATARKGPTASRAPASVPVPRKPQTALRPTPPTGSVRTTGAPRTAGAVSATALRAQPAGRVVKGPARERHEPDYLILISIVALAAIGILMIYSSSAASIARAPGTDPFSAIMPELVWVGIGLAVMLLLARLDYRWMRAVSVPAYIVAAVLLFIVLMPAFGPLQPIESGGAARWLRLGPLPQMHPAELAKLALVIYLAHWLARRGTQVGSLIRGLMPFLLIAGPIIGLIAMEPDLGTTGVVTLAAFTMFFVAGGSLLQLAAIVPLGIVALVSYVMTNEYQLQRWNTFLDPFADPVGTGFHTVQGLFALALGGVLGDGLGQSRGPGGLYLPNADNDYVFAMVGQELGLVGGLAVIGLFLFFAYRGLRVSRAAPDTFGGLLAVGITAWIAFQAFINIGVVVNLLPVTGITLPFVSSGGTSLVVSFAAVGILLSILVSPNLEAPSQTMRILIAAGGTGGHIYPALAVLHSLTTRSADLEVRWMGGHRGLESTVVPKAGYPLERLSLRTLRTVDLSAATLMDPVRLAVSVPQAAVMLGRWRPDVVFTTGGYVAIPALSAAALLRVPSLLWEGNRIAGRSVRATARLATALACSFAGTAAELPGRTYTTGTPIRSFAGVDRAAARVALGLPADAPVVLVFGGSQAVRRLNEAVADALPRVLDRVCVLHLTGDSAYAEALRRREALPDDQRERYRVHPFLGDEMASALVAADLLVGRAESSTLAEAAAVGLPLVVVPYPHAAAHQKANARELAEAGAAQLVADEAFDGAAFEAACAILDDPSRRASMAAASRALGRPGAANAVASLLLDLAEGPPLPDAGRIERETRVAP